MQTTLRGQDYSAPGDNEKNVGQVHTALAKGAGVDSVGVGVDKGRGGTDCGKEAGTGLFVARGSGYRQRVVGTQGPCPHSQGTERVTGRTCGSTRRSCSTMHVTFLPSTWLEGTT